MKFSHIIKLLILAVLILGGLFLLPSTTQYFAPSVLPDTPFKIQAIDTMKYSRDVAGQVLDNPQSFRWMIDMEMKLIADTGATHASIATPYDRRFIPVLKLWVNSARAHGLNVWFRGNFSGWEGWFDYSRISRATHKELLRDFLMSNPNLFEDGDVFTPCPECENGGSGDPRQTGDKSGFNQFLVDEYTISKEYFISINKDVSIYNSMNGDIAREVITPKVAEALGGTILVDHYVSSVNKFASDISNMSSRLHTTIGLGELGAPVPDLNGNMSQEEQANYIAGLLNSLYVKGNKHPIVNYWTLRGGSTAIVSDGGVPRKAYYVVKSYFNAPKIHGTISDQEGNRISKALITVENTSYSTESDASGMYSVFLAPTYRKITIEKEGYKTLVLDFPADIAHDTEKDLILESLNPTLWYKIKHFLRNIKSKMYVSN